MVLYLSIPENLRKKIESINDNNFSIDPDIPIPVEVPDDAKKPPLENLSWEMIVSGMLRVIASGEESAERIHYYRHFVLAVKPAIFEEFTEAAIIKARNGDFDLSLEILDALRGLFPASPSALLNRALVLEEKAAALERKGGESAQKAAQEAVQKAEAAYGEALALEPPFPDVYFNAGFFYLSRKDFFKAREFLSLYIGMVADTAADDEKTEKAKSVIREIDENGLGEFSFTEACRLIMRGEEEAGMRHIREFLELRPSVWNGWFVLGWALRRINRWQDGAAALAKAVELGGGNSDTRNEFAICLMESGDLNGAFRELETALHDDPENVKIISNLGVLALKNGRNEEAAAFFRTVLELDPDDPIAKEITLQE